MAQDPYREALNRLLKTKGYYDLSDPAARPVLMEYWQQVATGTPDLELLTVLSLPEPEGDYVSDPPLDLDEELECYEDT
jgi:hypothetical protein